MATIPYIPNFPYIGNQVIISSGRVTLHSKDDSVMFFGKKAIALSSLGSINFDVTDRVIINSPKIEFGLGAEKLGEPIVLGNANKLIMERLLDVLTNLGDALGKLNETELEVAVPEIVNTATRLAQVARSVRADLVSTLSNVTYSM